jgi:hypothetical protein
MATRSTIWLEKENGLEGVYAHWDGYLDNNGKILYQYYDTPDKVQNLINGGHLSVLKETVEETEFYNEENKIYFADTVEDTKEFAEEYNYIFRDGKWFYYSTWGVDEPKPLAPAII